MCVCDEYAYVCMCEHTHPLPPTTHTHRRNHACLLPDHSSTHATGCRAHCPRHCMGVDMHNRVAMDVICKNLTSPLRIVPAFCSCNQWCTWSHGLAHFSSYFHRREAYPWSRSPKSINISHVPSWKVVPICILSSWVWVSISPNPNQHLVLKFFSQVKNYLSVGLHFFA